ncbi:MAG TPA: hypothetical protein VJ805_09025 [Nitrospiraceae bacterium]|nr:hypothetical protein [Nitrospiraceae bacterium]
MKVLLYAAVVLIVVPLQTTFLNHVSVLDVRPDLCLIAVCLVGFWGGELDGLVLGIILGWSQDLLSAGDLWVNVVSKGGAGFVAGLAGRHLAHITPTVLLIGLAVISCVSSLAFVYSMKVSEWDAVWHAMYSKVFLQGVCDAAVGTAAYWLFMRRLGIDDMMAGDRY